MIKVLSIQSAVSYGHAGNSAAVFPLQRSGVDVWPVYTVTFSNNTSYGSWRGPLIGASDVGEVIQGINDRGVFNQVSAVLSGYQGGEDVGAEILRAVELVKSQSDAIYCADPVMGDVDRGFYARPGIPEFMRDKVTAAADIMTPNLFELEFLTDQKTNSTAEVVAAAQKLRQLGPEIVLVTSVTGKDVADDVLRMIAVSEDEVWQVDTPLLDRKFTGSGDLTTAMFLTHWMRTQHLGEALGNTASIVYSVLAHTTERDSRELLLVEAQENIVAPQHVFRAEAF